MENIRRYIDVNIFVYWLGNHPIFGQKAYEWIKRIDRSPKGTFVTATLSIYEIAVILAGFIGTTLKNKKFVEQVVNAINSLRGLVLEAITCEEILSAYKLMNKYNLDYEDALHLSVAFKVNAKEIISNDSDFDNLPIPRIF